MDEVDRALVNRLQDGISVCERPFAEPAERLGLDEPECLARIEALLEQGVLSRFGPLYDAERLGGAVTLCAMHVPEDQFETVAAKVFGQDVGDPGDAGLRIPGMLGRDQDARGE